jgi:ER-bound oxygenase mpaB/B'/Rubber oxygenase, catalytic domain
LTIHRFANFDEIRRLDPERDCQRIMHLLFGYEFPWDSIRALEIALYRTYCVPGISGLLDRTGEFYRAAQRRYDDTAILIAEICEWGYESGRGRQALERINWAHGHFKIANDDFLYVLSTFIFEPVKWIDAFGWRRLCDTERHAYYYFWREVGARMGIRDIPGSYGAFAQWSADFERAQFRYAESNRKIGTATRDLFASWAPHIAAPLVHYGIYALLDDAMIEAFGFPRPLPGSRSLIRGALKARGSLVRWLPPRRKPRFFTDIRNRTHPEGYDIARLGPAQLAEKTAEHSGEAGTKTGKLG